MHTPGNYRPVSLTVVACKILERIVCRHILNFLDDENDVLTHAQHGFHKGHSCETQLLTTLNDLFKSFDKRTQVDVGILDFSGAFDTALHERLLGKLASCGVTGPVNSWIQAFLTGRHMSIVVDGESRTRCRSSLGYLRERCWVRCSSSSASMTWLAKYPLVPLYACLQTTAWLIVKLTLPKNRLSYNKIFYVYRHGLNFGVCDSTHPNVISCILAGVNHLLNYMSFVLSSK